jgi:hypothetical protein
MKDFQFLWLTGWTFQCCQPASKAAHGLLPRPLDRSLAYPATLFAANGACEVAEVPISLAACPGDPTAYQPQISSRCFLNASLNHGDVCIFSPLSETNGRFSHSANIRNCSLPNLHPTSLLALFDSGFDRRYGGRVSDSKAQCPPDRASKVPDDSVGCLVCFKRLLLSVLSPGGQKRCFF